MQPIQEIKDLELKEKEDAAKPKSHRLSDKLKDGKISTVVPLDVAPAPKTPPRKRKKKEDIDTSEIVKPKVEKPTDDTAPMYQSSVPYRTQYEVTEKIIKDAIYQTDSMADCIADDIASIRDSKTLRSKWTSLGTMYQAYQSFISNKVAAARELNSSITKSIELDIKRAKEFHLNEDEDHDKVIMDTYKAFVSMPVGGNPYPYMIDTSAITAPDMLNRVPLGADPDAIYNNYLNNMTPEQALMKYESDPDVQTVVVYNKDTYDKYFALMNIRTGEFIDGIPVRDTATFMPDTVIDEISGTARNINLNESYKLVVIGGNNSVIY